MRAGHWGDEHSRVGDRHSFQPLISHAQVRAMCHLISTLAVWLMKRSNGITLQANMQRSSTCVSSGCCLSRRSAEPGHAHSQVCTSLPDLRQCIGQLQQGVQLSVPPASQAARWGGHSAEKSLLLFKKAQVEEASHCTFRDAMLTTVPISQALLPLQVCAAGCG